MQPGSQTHGDNFLIDAFRRTKRAFFYVGLFSLCINLLILSLPLYSLQVLDRVISSHSAETLLMLTLIALAMCVFYGVFTTLRSTILTRISEWLDMRVGPELLKIGVARAALGVPTSAGQQLRELGNIKNFITSGISNLFDAPWSILFILVIYMINPMLGFLCLIGSVILLGFAVLVEIISKKPLEKANQILLRSINLADTASRNAEAIESMGMMQDVGRNWQFSHSQSQEIQTHVNNRTNVVLALSRIVRMMLQIGITGIGCYLALHNQITIGGMIAASSISGRALAPFEAAIGVWKSMVNARDSFRRLNNMINQSPDFRGTMELPPPQGHVSVENVFYRPPGNPDRMIVRGVTFQLNAGESLGIIGPSAAGKSTLAKLVMGILPPSAGTVRLDGAELFKWNRANIGPHVGYMPQDVELFGGTIRENIARLNADASADAVIEAAQLAGVHEMILRLPKGYDTEISATNQSLSPGQRQRIGLARAVFGNPKFVVLDEPNSNLDAEGERALVITLNTLQARGVTTIVVAHRPSIVANVNKIIVLRDGAIEQHGNREEVLQKYIAPIAPQNRSAS